MATNGLRTRSWIAFIATLVLASALEAEDSRRIFLSESRGEWCGFPTAKDLEDSPRDQDPEYVVTVESQDNRPSAISIRRSTEDTATYDEYTVTSSGGLSKLTRTLDAISSRITRIQIWDLGKHPPIRISESWTELGTRKSIVPDHRLDDFIDHAIITRVDEFPFAPLISDTRLWLGSKQCMIGDAVSNHLKT